MIYLIKVGNPRGDDIEMIISAKDESKAVKILKKELKHQDYNTFSKSALREYKYILKQLKEQYISVQKAIKERSSYRSREDITADLDRKRYCVGDFYFSYNDYKNNPGKFEKDILNAYEEYYYREGYSLEYHLDNDIFEIINLSELALERGANVTKVLNKTFIYHGS